MQDKVIMSKINVQHYHVNIQHYYVNTQYYSSDIRHKVNTRDISYADKRLESCCILTC